MAPAADYSVAWRLGFTHVHPCRACRRSAVIAVDLGTGAQPTSTPDEIRLMDDTSLIEHLGKNRSLGYSWRRRAMCHPAAGAQACGRLDSL
jgi:hypothetical protein